MIKESLIMICKLVVLSCFFFLFAGCGECEKLSLSADERMWVEGFIPGQSSFFKSIGGKVDTVLVVNVNNYYTPCNKVELSKYQYEVYLVQFRFQSDASYDGEDASMVLRTEEWKPDVPYIYFGNLGPYRNDLENKMPLKIDTILNEKHFRSIYFYSIGFNVEQYGEQDFFKNFFWDQATGLIAYTTVAGELFVREEK